MNYVFLNGISFLKIQIMTIRDSNAYQNILFHIQIQKVQTLTTLPKHFRIKFYELLAIHN